MQYPRVVFVLLFSSLLVTLAIAQQPTAPMQIHSGKISGLIDKNGVVSYLGVPFAKAPVGELRWRPPQPEEKWPGVRKADHFGASCMQPAIKSFLPWTEEFMTQGPVSEDCLFLNIWTTAKKGQKQAVMLFLHGGGFGGGSGSIPVYNGAELAKKGVVVVNTNYRVGAFGFLVHPELTKESDHRSSGNYGLLDQIAALRWIKENIAAFGGDPGNVTIFGQSAGAISVIDLMRSPLAQGLFQRAISQSDPSIFISGADELLGSKDLKEREQQGVNYAQSIGAPSLAELRKLPAEEFVKGDAFPTPGSKSNIYRGGPVTDGWVLTNTKPAQQVPLMTGFVAGDVNMMDGLGPPPPATVTRFETDAKKAYGENAAAFLQLYPVSKDADVPATRQASREDQARVALDIWSAEQIKRSPTVYTYFFDRAIPWPAHPEFGAFHTAEVPYIFQTLTVLDRPWQPIDFKLSEAMSSYWANFAKAGDPNVPGLENWPKYNPKNYTTMQLGNRIGAMPEAPASKLTFLIEALSNK